MERFDVIIIGSGPAGYVSAIRLADLGKNVAVIEHRDIGGTCLHRGCIPTKTLLHSAFVYETAKRARLFGINCEVSCDFGLIQQRKEKVIKRLLIGVESLMKNRGVTVKKGKGRLITNKSVEINEREIISAESIVIATGSEPATLSEVNIDEENIITSDTALNMRNLPKDILIVGAGAVGIEFATFFSAFGTKVTIIEMMNDILPELRDRKITAILQKALQKRGIVVKSGMKLEQIEVNQGTVATLSTGERLRTDKVLLSTGRRLNTSGLGLKDIGLKTERDRILVDNKMRTNIPNIYAIGDVTGGMLMAHKAQCEGIVCAEVIAGLDSVMDYRVIPWVVFSRPELACVGMTDEEAQEKGITTVVGEFPFIASGKAVVMGETEGMVKIIADANTEEVIGAQIIGPDASIIISELALAVKNRLKIKEIGNTIHPHPTLSETVMESCKDAMGEAIHK